MKNPQYTLAYASPAGILTLASDGENITGLWIESQKYYGAALEKKTLTGPLPVFNEATNWLDQYFKGEQPDTLPPLAPKGSEFQKIIWGILCEIPYGNVTTYGAIAKKAAAILGRETMAAQAVGSAVGRNPISILIPCHRVVGANGSLTGYAGGIQRKIQFLQLENVDTNRFIIPTKGSAL